MMAGPFGQVLYNAFPMVRKVRTPDIFRLLTEFEKLTKTTANGRPPLDEGNYALCLYSKKFKR
jgi:hypothetical protein